jgi:hypothetical protein
MDHVDSSSDLHHLVPVIVPQGGAAMTGSARDLKLYAETQSEKADANKFQQRLTCRGPASLQYGVTTWRRQHCTYDLSTDARQRNKLSAKQGRL